MIDAAYRALKQAVIDARGERDLRVWMLERTTAEAEQRAIDALGGDPKALGANDLERKRTLTLQLNADGAYTDARTALLAAERSLLEAEADLDAYAETRRKEREDTQRALAEAIRVSGRLLP